MISWIQVKMDSKWRMVEIYDDLKSLKGIKIKKLISTIIILW